MKVRFALLLIAGIAIAVVTGWLVDLEEVSTRKQALQAPDNIDYYMKGVNYRAYNDAGQLQYRLVTPYLEHFIREDASHLQQPDIHYFGPTEQWKLRAGNGVLQHADEILSLNKQARVERVQSIQPLLLESESIILHSRQEQMEIPTPMILTQGALTLHAAGAMLDIKQQRHQFKRVKATYDDRPDVRG